MDPRGLRPGTRERFQQVLIYETSSAEQVQWIYISGAVGVFLESDRNVEVFESVAAELVAVAQTWVFDHGAIGELRASGGDVSDAELEDGAPTSPRERRDDHLHLRERQAGPRDARSRTAPDVRGRRHDRRRPRGLRAGQLHLLFLPLAHVFAGSSRSRIRGRVRLGHTADVANLLDGFSTLSPSFLLSVPRVFEKVFNGAQQKAVAAEGNIPNTAAGTAIAYPAPSTPAVPDCS